MQHTNETGHYPGGSVLTDDQVSHFKREGFVQVPGFFSPDEIAALRAEVGRMYAEGQMRNVATRGDGETRNTQAQNLQLIPLDTRSDLFRSLPFAPAPRRASTSMTTAWQ